jgi:hypothetical protein
MTIEQKMPEVSRTVADHVCVISLDNVCQSRRDLA